MFLFHPPPSNEHLLITFPCISVGFGREMVLDLLQRGDKVIATARTISKIQDLKDAGADILRLDVTDTLENLKTIAAEAIAVHGRVDVLVNNAGYVMAGALEDNTYVHDSPLSFHIVLIYMYHSPQETFEQFK